MASAEAQLEQYFSKILKRVEARLKQEEPEIKRKLVSHMETEIKDRFKEAVDSFYEDYTPAFYQRNYSLYNILEVETGKDYLKYTTSDEKMTKMRGGGSLYDLVYKEGWHGGASESMSLATKSYRVPVPNQDGDGYHYPAWGNPAVRAAMSPMEVFQILLQDYEQNELPADYRALAEEAFKKIKL